MGSLGQSFTMKGGFGKATHSPPTSSSWQLTLSSVSLKLPLRKVTSRHGEVGRPNSGYHDAALFVNPCKEYVDLTMEILARFGEATGLKINMSKCFVLPIRCADLNLDNILASFGGLHASFPISYLGLPLTLNRLRLVHPQPILDNAKARLAGWQGKLLALGGRRE